MNVQFYRTIQNIVNIVDYVKIAALAGILLIGLPAVCSIQAADTDNFYAQSIVPDGKILAIIPLQFDGVGADELAVAVRNEQRGFRLLIYRESTARNYQNTPALSIDMPASVFAIQAVDLDGDNRAEIGVARTRSAVLESILMKADIPRQAKELPGSSDFIAVPRPDFVVEYDFSLILNGDRSFDAVLPCWDGVRVLKSERSGFARWCD